MKINDEHIKGLLQMLSLTKEVETDCEHCLQHMAEFAETELSGKTIPEGLKSIDEHLQRCPDCREEFQALKEALSGDSFV